MLLVENKPTTIIIRGVMKSNQGGAKLSLVVVSVIVLGISAWFNQANAAGVDVPEIVQSQS